MLFHLHIPKTGGTSLFSMLAAAVDPARWHIALSEQELVDRREGYELLGGHFTWDTLSLFAEPPRVVTVLRDPVEIVLSTYSYWRSRARDGIFGPASQVSADEAVSHTIDELLLNPRSNLSRHLGSMTYYLAGQSAIDAERGLESAMRNLDSCAWVGTTETLARDIQVLPAMLGLKKPIEMLHQNESRDRTSRDDLSESALQILSAATVNDRLLYEKAQGIAEEQQRLYG